MDQAKKGSVEASPILVCYNQHISLTLKSNITILLYHFQPLTLKSDSFFVYYDFSNLSLKILAYALRAQKQKFPPNSPERKPKKTKSHRSIKVIVQFVVSSFSI